MDRTFSRCDMRTRPRVSLSSHRRELHSALENNTRQIQETQMVVRWQTPAPRMRALGTHARTSPDAAGHTTTVQRRLAQNTSHSHSLRLSYTLTTPQAVDAHRNRNRTTLRSRGGP